MGTSRRLPSSRSSRLRCKDICNCDMKLSDIDVNKWGSYGDDRTIDRTKWRRAVRESMMRVEGRRHAKQEVKKGRWKQRGTSSLLPTNHHCSGYRRLPLQNWPSEQLPKIPKETNVLPIVSRDRKMPTTVYHTHLVKTETI